MRILDPSSGQTLFCQEIGPSHAVLSACLCTFAARPEDGPMLVVGCARSLSFDPLASEGGVLHVFRFTQGGRTLELLHSTDTKEEVVGALCPFQGRLLAGLGNTLRLYDIGRKKLLRKCENRGLPTSIREIRVLGERIFAADNQESVHLLKYRKSDNVMSVLADDTLPRYVTCTAVLDYDTIAVADKFGNVNVLRLPPDVSRRIEGDPSSGKALEGVSWLNGAPHKFEAGAWQRGARVPTEAAALGSVCSGRAAALCCGHAHASLLGPHLPVSAATCIDSVALFPRPRSRLLPRRRPRDGPGPHDPRPRGLGGAAVRHGGGADRVLPAPGDAGGGRLFHHAGDAPEARGCLRHLPRRPCASTGVGI